MYLRHFALTRFPFHDNVHTDELFDSGAITEAEARLHHLLELKGIGLLTGEVGSGVKGNPVFPTCGDWEFPTLS